MAPEALEGLGPLVQRANGFGIGAVQHAAAVAANVDQAYVLEHAEVLGDGGLFESQEAQDIATAGFGNGVEGVGGGGSARHGKNIYPYRNMLSRGFCAYRMGPEGTARLKDPIAASGSLWLSRCPDGLIVLRGRKVWILQIAGSGRLRLPWFPSLVRLLFVIPVRAWRRRAFPPLAGGPRGFGIRLGKTRRARFPR